MAMTDQELRALLGTYPGHIQALARLLQEGAIAPPAAKGLVDGRPFGIVSVTEFGAKGDGVTDDTLAIQTAINNAPRGTIVFFPAGTYAISDPIIIDRKPIFIQGCGIDNTIIKRTNIYKDGLMITGTGGEGIAVHVENLSIRGPENYPNSSDVGVALRITDATYTVMLRNLLLRANGYGLRLHGNCWGVHLQNVQCVWNQLYGLSIAGAANALFISQSRFSHNLHGIVDDTGSAINFGLLVVRDSILENNRGKGIYRSGQSGIATIIDSCWFENNGISTSPERDYHISLTGSSTSKLSNILISNCILVDSNGIYITDADNVTLINNYINAFYNGASYKALLIGDTVTYCVRINNLIPAGSITDFSQPSQVIGRA